MATKVSKKVDQQQDDDVTPEELERAQMEIAELTKAAQQLRDLKQAAASGDHKLVFSKLGVRVAPSAPQAQPPAQPQPAQNQQGQQPGQAPQLGATPQGAGEQLDQSQWQQINAAFSQQNKVLQDTVQALNATKQELSIIKAEQQQTQLKNAMSLEIDQLIKDGDLPFLDHVDKSELLESVVSRLKSFQDTYGYQTTVGQVLSEINKKYENVFDKFVDKHHDVEDDEGENEDGEVQQASDEGEDESQKADSKIPEDEQDYEFTDEGTQADGDKKPVVKLVDPGDEDAKNDLIDGLLDKHMTAKYGDNPIGPNTRQ